MEESECLSNPENLRIYVFNVIKMPSSGEEYLLMDLKELPLDRLRSSLLAVSENITHLEEISRQRKWINKS